MLRYIHIPDKTGWYRVRERERTRYPCTLTEGEGIYTNRIIARVGYWIDPRDTPQDYINERVKAYVKNTINLVLEGNFSLALDPRYLWNNDIPGPISPGDASLIAAGLNIGTRIEYHIRKEWFEAERLKPQPHPVDLRTFWYADLEEPIFVKIKKVERKVCGQIHYSSTIDFQNYITPFVTQDIYLVGRNTNFDQLIYVHPLDVIREI